MKPGPSSKKLNQVDNATQTAELTVLSGGEGKLITQEELAKAVAKAQVDAELQRTKAQLATAHKEKAAVKEAFQNSQNEMGSIIEHLRSECAILAAKLLKAEQHVHGELVQQVDSSAHDFAHEQEAERVRIIQTVDVSVRGIVRACVHPFRPSPAH